MKIKCFIVFGFLALQVTFLGLAFGLVPEQKASYISVVQ
jgi:hypothetical protein